MKTNINTITRIYDLDTSTIKDFPVLLISCFDISKIDPTIIPLLIPNPTSHIDK